MCSFTSTPAHSGLVAAHGTSPGSTGRGKFVAALVTGRYGRQASSTVVSFDRRRPRKKRPRIVIQGTCSQASARIRSTRKLNLMHSASVELLFVIEQHEAEPFHDK